ncbi:hypothetical protein OTU49_016324, partial [Cherax quadricarinatus]
MEVRRRQERREGKDRKDPKDGKTGQAGKTTTAKLKERWLLTRKTWRYMSDAGKKLFPDGVNPQRTEDIPQVEEHFQKINNRSREYILWPQPQVSPRTARRRRKRLTSVTSDTTDTGEDYEDTDDDILDGVGGVAHGGHGVPGTLGMSAGEGMVPIMGMSSGAGTVHGLGTGTGILTSPTAGMHASAASTSGIPWSPGTSSAMYTGATNYGPAFQMPPQPGGLHSGASLPVIAGHTRERILAAGELRYELPPEVYQQLLRSYGSCNLHHVASRLLEEQLTEEDEDDEDLEVLLPATRSVGCQTDPHLDMCVQTDDDATAEDMVKVGAESRSVTEAAAAEAQAQARAEAQALQQAHGATAPTAGAAAAATDAGLSNTSMLKKLWQRRESAASANVKLEELQQTAKDTAASKKLVSDKDRDAHLRKGVVAAKLAWAEKAAAAGGAPVVPPGQKPKHEKTPEKSSKLKNVFKLGLKCDVDQAGGTLKKSIEKTKIDKFKTVNYDKTLRNIKSKWVPNTEHEDFLKQYQYKEEKRIKKKAKGIQVGEPLPQFILAGFRINVPVEIIRQRRKSRRRLSKADSSDVSSSECSISFPPSLPTSPRYSITVTDDMGTRDMLVSEAEALRICQMGAHVVYKRSSIDASVDTSEFEVGEGAVGGLPQYQRSISALQASGHLAQMIHHLRGRGSHPQVNPGQGGHRSNQGLLQSLLPAVMQRTRSGGSGHASRLVPKKIWRARSKSQSRASVGTTSIWTPM